MQCEWLTQNWPVIAQTAGIVGAISLGVWQSRQTWKVSQVSVNQAIAASHRAVWSTYLSCPELSDVFEDDRSPESATESEKRSVILLTIHVESSYRAGRANLIKLDLETTDDIQETCSYRRPKTV